MFRVLGAVALSTIIACDGGDERVSITIQTEVAPGAGEAERATANAEEEETARPGTGEAERATAAAEDEPAGATQIRAQSAAAGGHGRAHTAGSLHANDGTAVHATTSAGPDGVSGRLQVVDPHTGENTDIDLSVDVEGLGF